MLLHVSVSVCVWTHRTKAGNTAHMDAHRKNRVGYAHARGDHHVRAHAEYHLHTHVRVHHGKGYCQPRCALPVTHTHAHTHTHAARSRCPGLTRALTRKSPHFIVTALIGKAVNLHLLYSECMLMVVLALALGHAHTSFKVCVRWLLCWHSTCADVCFNR